MIMKQFIQDKERVLNTATDLLKTSVYAENLVKMIENTPKNKVFTIGVFGGWGTGKSSIIRTAQDKVESAHNNMKFITYDAWKYANDSFRRMFLLKIQQKLRMRQTEEMSRFYQSETAEAEPKTTLSIKGITLAAWVVTIICAIIFLLNIPIKWQIIVPTFGIQGIFLLTLLNGCFYDLKISYSKPALFAPEQFEECFKQMMSKCLKDIGWIKEKWENLKDYVEVGEVSIKGLEKLVIVIDNIDRCPSDMAYQLLTDIKTFLSNEEYNLVFVVPVDDEALKKHLFRKLDQKNGYNIDKEKEEFLRKFFNVTLRIKPHQETELMHFAHEINRENNLCFSNDTLAIVAKEFADNPRRIIQLLNNLTGDLALYEDEFANKNETAICVAQILQEDYPDFYKRVAKDLNLVKHFDPDGVNKEETNKLKSFMRIADYAMKQISIENLQRIFTNTSSIFSGLPTDLQDSVRTYDAAKVIEFVNNNRKKSHDVIDYLNDSLKKDVKYAATAQTINWIDFLSRLYAEGVFDSSNFKEIDDLLSSHYMESVHLISNPNALCSMANHMSVVGFPSLRNTIIDYLNAENTKEDSNFVNVLYAYFANFTSDEDSCAIAKVVEDYYNDNPLDKEIAYTESQIENIYGDSFVISQTNGLNATDDKIRIENIIWCIKNNKKLTSETFTTLFDKFIKLFGNTRAKSKDKYLTLISHLKVLFDVLPTKSRGQELASIFNLVTSERNIPNPSWPSNTQYDTRKSILEEIDYEDAKTVTAFCYEIMRITGGGVNISSAIDKLYKKCKDAVIDGALKIHSLGISIAPLAGTLILANDYNSEKDLSLLEIIMSRQSDGTLVPNDDAVKNKIHELIANANNNGIESLIGKLASDKQILDMVAEYVASLDSETINGLPVTISRYAVRTFEKNNAEAYKDNTDFLILVLKQGNASQIRDVVRLMKHKINYETDIDQVVTVLENLKTENQQVLKSLVSELDGIKDSDAIVDEVKSKVVALITKLSTGIKKESLLNKVLRKKS